MNTLLIALYIIGFTFWMFAHGSNWDIEMNSSYRDLSYAKRTARRFFLAPIWPIALVWFSSRFLIQISRSAFRKENRE